MRTIEELEKVAFKEPLTFEQDGRLADLFASRAAVESNPRQKTPHLKQAAFFASRAFDKGERDPEILRKFVALMTDEQKLTQNAGTRRKLNEIKSTLAGKDTHAAILKKLGRKGTAGSKKLLATDEQIHTIEATLEVTLPASYKQYLKSYAHRQIGTFEPYTVNDLEAAVREAWQAEMESHFFPFLEDNGDYYCLDMRSKVKEPAVVFWSPNGTSNETWPTFTAWVEECWLAELDE